MILNPGAMMRSAGHWPQRLLPLVAGLIKWLLIAAILWLLAGLFWRVAVSPDALPPSQGSRDAVTLAGNIVARQLFGVPAQAGPAAQSGAVMPNLVLRGVLSGKIKQRPVAIVSVNGAPPTVVREGDELAAGVRLEKVSPTQIEVLAAGLRQTVPLTK